MRLLRKVILQYFPYESLILRAPGLRISNQKSASKVTWKRNRKQNQISNPRCPRALKMGSRNHPEIAEDAILDPHVSFLLLPRSPRCPQCAKMISKGAKVEAPALPNHSLGHKMTISFSVSRFEKCFENDHPEASEPAHISTENEKANNEIKHKSDNEKTTTHQSGAAAIARQQPMQKMDM